MPVNQDVSASSCDSDDEDVEVEEPHNLGTAFNQLVNNFVNQAMQGDDEKPKPPLENPNENSDNKPDVDDEELSSDD